MHMSLDFKAVLHDHSLEVIANHKWHMNMGLILNGDGGKGTNVTENLN
jgi:hypothetical protein